MVYVDLLGIPLLNVDIDQMVAIILNLLESEKKTYCISFLDPLRLMEMKFSRKKFDLMSKNQIFLAEGKGLSWASAMLAKKSSKRMTKQLKGRIPRIVLLMELLDIANIKGFSLYFLSNLSLKKTGIMQRKLLKIFPKMRIIGNHSKKQSVAREDKIKQALHKAGPDLIMIGGSFWKEEKWIKDNWKFFSRGVVLALEQTFLLLYGGLNRVSFVKSIYESGYSWVWRIILQPWRLDYWFYLIAFFALVMYHRIFGKSAT